MQRTGYHERIAMCRRADLSAFVPWCAGDCVVGRVHVDRLALLRDHSAFSHHGATCRLTGSDFASRSEALAHVVDALYHRGELREPTGEMYPVGGGPGHAPMLQVDRTAVTWFGVQAFGVHMNGFTRDRDPCVWIAERARGKRTFPGHLDNTVAGGQSIELSTRATLTKECGEEAAIPKDLAERAVYVGSIDYVQQDGLSLKVDSLACFDLELPPGFVPTPHDGEVERFERMSTARLAASLRGDAPWKPNSALVALHFLLRFGALDGELDAADRWRLWQQLHGELP